jgi:ASC-1-like (ASCH) protein
MIHELKCLAPYFDAVRDGRKTFECRVNDRGFQAGDILRLTRITDAVSKMPVAHDTLDVTVTYVLHGSVFGIEPAYCVMGIKL